MAFVRNQWYVAAWGHELGRSLLARRILGDPLVLYRTERGEPVALADRCSHRLMPLSMGKLIGDRIQCGYHGMEFDCAGRAVRVPNQDRVPANAFVRRYPVIERMGMIFIWTGDPEKAVGVEPHIVPQWGAKGWTLSTGPLTHIKANYQLLTENLADPYLC